MRGSWAGGKSANLAKEGRGRFLRGPRFETLYIATPLHPSIVLAIHNLVLSPYRNRERRRAFSLVEVAFALSIVSFACLTLLGLLSDGLVTVNRAIGTTVQGEIIQSIVNESQVHTYNSGYTTNLYFNDEGTSVTSVDPSQIYVANLTAVPLQIGGSSYPQLCQ